MITRDAAQAIADVLEAEPDDAGFRIAQGTQSLNGAGPALEMELAPEPEEDDEVIDEQGVRLFVEARAAQALDGKVLDAEVDGDEVRFALLEAD